MYGRCKPIGGRKLNFLNFLRALSALHEECGGRLDVWGAASKLAARLRHKQMSTSPLQWVAVGVWGGQGEVELGGLGGVLGLGGA